MDLAIKYALGFSVIGNREEYYSLFKKISNNLFIDRLYRKYVKQEDVQSTISALDDCSIYCAEEDKLKILKLKNCLIKGNEMSVLCLKDYGTYIPCSIVLFNEPYCSLSENISLEDYDNNNGEPFWMRPECITEKYGKNDCFEVNTITPNGWIHSEIYEYGKKIFEKSNRMKDKLQKNKVED